MKHLFLVHSPITFLVTQQLLKTEALPKEDCIILLSRNFKLPGTTRLQTAAIPADKAGNSDRIWSGLHLLRTRRQIRYYDQWLNSLVNEAFYFYTPHTASDLENLIISHEHCKGYYIIEEGIGSYRATEPFPFKGWRGGALKALQAACPRLYTAKASFCNTRHPKFTGGYGIGKGVFPHAASGKVKILPLPFTAVKLAHEVQAVIVIDYLQGLGDALGNEAYTEVLRQTAGQLAASGRYRAIAYKFHPSHYIGRQEFIGQVRRLFQQTAAQHNITIDELPQEVLLENVAYSYHPDFYGLFSSALFYAAVIGCKTYGMNRLLLQADPQYKHYWDKLPALAQPAEEL